MWSCLLNPGAMVICKLSPLPCNNTGRPGILPPPHSLAFWCSHLCMATAYLTHELFIVGLTRFMFVVYACQGLPQGNLHQKTTQQAIIVNHKLEPCFVLVSLRADRFIVYKAIQLL